MRTGLQVVVSLLAVASMLWSPTAAAPRTRPAASAAVPLPIEELSDGSRRVHHRAGVTVVPARPERICALSFADELVCLGLVPSAVPTDWSGRKIDYLAAELEAAEPIPHGLGRWLPSHQAIAAHEPDLILTWGADRHAYEQLARIAPTVVVRTLGEVLVENGDLEQLEGRLRDVARIVGHEQRAEEAVRSFRADLQAARERLAAPMAGSTIAFLRARGRQWRLYGRHDDCGGEAVYLGLGLAAPHVVAENGLELDPQRLLELDADYLLVVADHMLGSEETLDRLRASPLWRRVPAVRAGRVYEVPAFEHWILSGLAGKRRMLADVVACVSGREAQ